MPQYHHPTIRQECFGYGYTASEVVGSVMLADNMMDDNQFHCMELAFYVFLLYLGDMLQYLYNIQEYILPQQYIACSHQKHLPAEHWQANES